MEHLLKRKPQAWRGIAALFFLLANGQGAAAAELKEKTLAAFQRYLQLTEARVETELSGTNRFLLWTDAQPAPRREALYQQLRQGKVVVERLETRARIGTAGEQRIKIEDGLIHHWLGVVFISGATLAETLALVQDYDRHQEIYAPDVQRSKLLERRGEDFRIYLRLYKKKIITGVLNTEHEVHYRLLDATRATSRSWTTRIAEVENPGQPEEREKPFGRDRGLLWGLHSWWRFEEKDGGVYVQVESVSLTRAVPPGLGWLIEPFIRSLPRELLLHILRSTRTALLKGASTQTPGSASP
jgi:hypothetical protein